MIKIPASAVKTAKNGDRFFKYSFRGRKYTLKIYKHRSDHFVARFKNRNKEIWLSTDSSDPSVAAANFEKKMLERFDDSLAPRERPVEVATVGQVINVYLKEAVNYQTVKPAVARTNVNQLRKVLRLAFPEWEQERREALAVTELTKEIFGRYLEIERRKAMESDDPYALKRKNNTYNSLLGNVSSLFSREMLKEYKARGLRVPGNPIQDIKRLPPFEYTYNPDNSWADLDGLERDVWGLPDGDVKSTVLLALYAGLRLGEIKAMPFSWLEQTGQKYFIHIFELPRWKVKKGHERTVPIRAEVGQYLMRLSEKTDRKHVIENSKVCEREASDWVEGFMNPRRIDRKTIHQLRKHFGSRVLTSRPNGLPLAKKWLGHAPSSRVTEEVYASLLTKMETVEPV